MHTREWRVPPDHPAFPGHFPGQPILPGVVLLDQALRFAAEVFALDVARQRLASTKFLNPVAPGETLQFSLQQKPSGSIQFDVRCGERSIATGSFSPRAEAST